MKIRLLSLFLISSCFLHAAARAEGEAPAAAPAPAPAPAPAASEHTFTGNLGFVSDYRFRGISQTWKQPAIQGGFDYSHNSGLYAGTWASNVSGNSYNNGAGMEWDLYGGWKTAVAEGVTLDLGALAYVYPGAKLNAAPGQPTSHRYDNVDLYAALSAGAFSAKLSVAATDYFGLDSDTAGYAYFSALPAKGSSKGTSYLDLNYNADMGQGVTVGLHVGHLWVRSYGDLSYTDWKLSVSKELKDFGGVVVSLAAVGTDAKKDLYQVGDSAASRAKRVGGTGVVLGLSKAF